MIIDIFVIVNFSGIAKKYAAMHLGDYSDEELQKAKNMAERIEGGYPPFVMTKLNWFLTFSSSLMKLKVTI